MCGFPDCREEKENQEWEKEDEGGRKYWPRTKYNDICMKMLQEKSFFIN